jgi:hypothetical protein
MSRGHILNVHLIHTVFSFQVWNRLTDLAGKDHGSFWVVDQNKILVLNYTGINLRSHLFCSPFQIYSSSIDFNFSLCLSQDKPYEDKKKKHSNIPKKKSGLNWGCNPVVEHLPSMHKALVWFSAPGKKRPDSPHWIIGCPNINAYKEQLTIFFTYSGSHNSLSHLFESMSNIN